MNGFIRPQTRDPGAGAAPGLVPLSHLRYLQAVPRELPYTRRLREGGPATQAMQPRGRRGPPHRPQMLRETRSQWEPCFFQTYCFSPFLCIFFLLIVSTSGNVEIYFLIRRKKTLPTERPTRKDRPDEPSGF